MSDIIKLIVHRHTNTNRNKDSGSREVSWIMNYNMITLDRFKNYCKQKYYGKKIISRAKYPKDDTIFLNRTDKNQTTMSWWKILR